jgi:hypothetical protein
MPNLNFNAGFEPDEGAGGGENLSALGFHPADENEEDLAEESDEDAEEDFDLAADDDSETAAPVFNSAVSGQTVSADDEDEAEEESAEEETDEDSEDDEGEELTEETEDEEDLNEDFEEDEGEDNGEDCVLISKSKIILARQLLENIQKNSASLISLFSGQLAEGDEERISIAEISDGLIESDDEGGRVIEGVFDGENMIGPDGKEYAVPANYASKSKLVEGDMLKLTITDRGTFVYKQTKPVERKRVIGKLEKDANGNYLVKAEHKKFRALTASITYYKGVPGDKVVLLLPIAGDSAWGAVDNVIKSK